MSEKKGFFARLREGMSKSREQIAAVTEDALQADAPIDEELYDALLDAMILSDMGARPALRKRWKNCGRSSRPRSFIRRRRRKPR